MEATAPETDTFDHLTYEEVADRWSADLFDMDKAMAWSSFEQSEFQSKITVRLLGCKGLRGVDSSGTSDPYVKFTWGTPHYGEKVRPHHKSAHLKKVFTTFQFSLIALLRLAIRSGNEAFVINEFFGKVPDKLEIEVWDWNRIHKDTKYDFSPCFPYPSITSSQGLVIAIYFCGVRNLPKKASSTTTRLPILFLSAKTTAPLSWSLNPT